MDGYGEYFGFYPHYTEAEMIYFLLLKVKS